MKITFIKTGKRLKQDENKKVKSNHNKTTDKDKLAEGLKIILKKNQIVLLTLALMLITAGYMNYNNNDEINISLAELGDAQLVSTNIVENQIIETSESNLNEVNVNISENNISEENKIETLSDNNTISEDENNIKQTGNTQNTNYFMQTKLERETMYSQMIETYEKILENQEIPADQKSIASNEIKNINNKKSAISIIENLIKTKGFEDVVILINDNNINVIVKKNENLSTEEVAQITNIVSRELNSNIEDIHISTHD